MTSFNEENLKKKLVELNMSQQSIQTLSLWLIHHKKHAPSIVNVWYKELIKASESKKLALMYLANDVIQNSKKKGPEYRKQYISILPKVFKHLGSLTLGEKCIKGVRRLLQVWGERGVFDAETVKIFSSRIGVSSGNGNDGEVKKRRSESNDFHVSEKKHKKHRRKEKFEPSIVSDDDFPSAIDAITDIRVPNIPLVDSPLAEPDVAPAEPSSEPKADIKPVDPEELINALQALENAATADAEVRKKIAGLPPSVSDISGFSKLTSESERKELEKKVNEALEMLQAYNKRLTEEMDSRKKVAKLLHNFICYQKDLLSQAEETLEDHKSKYEGVQKTRQELKAHLQNLPDISKLPSLGGGLMPLPSAGDLFT